MGNGMGECNIQSCTSLHKVAAEFSAYGCPIYPASYGATPVDLIIQDEDEAALRVEVKSTRSKNSHGSYKVDLRRHTRNATGQTRKLCDNSQWDILAVYLVEIDVTCFFLPGEVLSKHAICLAPEVSESKYCGNPQRLISDFVGVHRVMEERKRLLTNPDSACTLPQGGEIWTRIKCSVCSWTSLFFHSHI